MVQSLGSGIMKRTVASARALPTSKDVAERAGVSQSTVSYVMTGKRAISDDTRRRVEDAMRELGYHPNAGARALRGSRTNVIALVVHLGTDADLSETMPYIETVIEEARKRDYEVVLSTTDEGPAAIRRLAGRRVCDAFVMMDVRLEDDRIPVAAELGLPVVLIGRPGDSRGLDAVDFDSALAASLLVDELADTGHRHIRLVGETAGAEDAFPFMAEFHEAARERARERHVDLQVVGRPREGWAGIKAIEHELLEMRQDRLGLIARTPQVTEWLLQLLDIHGLTPGRDVSLVSKCTDASAVAWDPQVTNVASEPRELSALGMRLLFDRIDGDDSPSKLELVRLSKLTRRETTARFD